MTVHPEIGGAINHLPFTFERTNTDESLKIILANDTPDGAGARIRGSVWLAAVTAAMFRKDPMNGVRITVEFSGDVDGPSAGGVMCLSVLSAMAGRQIPDDFSMTGTIMGEINTDVFLPSFSPFSFSPHFSLFTRLKDTVIVSKL